MKKSLLLLLSLVLLLSGCGSKTPEQTAILELEKTDWPAVSTDAEAFALDGGFDNAKFAYVFEHTDTVPLDQLIAFALAADSLSEAARDELRTRFLEAPNTVLAYLVLMGEQKVKFGEQLPAAEAVCGLIATADAGWYGGSEDFTQTMEACRKNYPAGPAAHLLNVMEAEHQACLEQKQG